MQSDTESNSVSSQRELPSALHLHILSLLPPNGRALSGRLVSPDAANGLSGPHHCTASLSLPLPPHAVPWAVAAGQQHVRQLPFRHKLQLLCTAAASGSEVNLEVALALLQPSIFPELLNSRDSAWVIANVPPTANPGVAAVTAGHPQLLGWLLSHCAGLVDRWEVLKAAARHCNLAGLQTAVKALPAEPQPAGQDWILDGAAESTTPDALAKMGWLLGNSRGRLRPQESTAAAAARSGDLGRLRWLRARGCPMAGLGVLKDALQHADLAVAQWLVDEVGCALPPAVNSENETEGEDEGEWAEADDERERGWVCLLEAAARSSDGLAKVGWLQHRRQVPLRASQLARIARAAAEQGRTEMVQHALSVLGPGAISEGVAHAAVESGSLPMVQLLRDAGVAFDHTACQLAARTGSLAMVRWLACDAGVTMEGLDLDRMVRLWPHGSTAATSRELLQAVQLLVEQAGWRGWQGTSWVVEAAAKRGNLGLVQYMMQQRPGYLPAWGVGGAAVTAGCEALLEWLAEQHPWCVTEAPACWSLYESAVAAGDLGTLTVLRRLGVPWGAEDVVARVVARCGFVPAALHWLVEQGAPVGSHEEMQRASKWLGLGADRRGVRDWLLGLVTAEAASGEEA